MLLVPASPPFTPSSPPSQPKMNRADLLDINPHSDRIMHDLRMPISNAFANAVAVTPNGRYAYISIFAFPGGSGGVWLVDLRHFRTVKVIRTGDVSVWGVGITPNGRFVFATNFEKDQLAVIDTRTNR